MDQVFTSSQTVSPKIILKYKGKNSNFLVGKVDRHHLNQGLNLTPPRVGQTNVQCLWMRRAEMVKLSLPRYICPKCISESSQEETDKSKLRHILQRNRPVPMKKCHGQEKPSTAEKLFQMKENKRHMTIKCNM